MLRREFSHYLGTLIAASPMIHLQGIGEADHTTILFQGDSITDGGRDRGHYYANSMRGMGKGYVAQVATELLGGHPDKSLKIYNRGISGHKVHQLQERWVDDCLNLKPDILSVMIGVNDYWHTLTHSYAAGPDVYKSDLLDLLNSTKKELPNIKMIIAEPFYVRGGTSINNEVWKADFPIYQSSCREVAEEIQAAFIPLQSMHPSLAGSYLMSEAWLAVLKEMI
jgi:lysophospholipase L1-like esterase